MRNKDLWKEQMADTNPKWKQFEKLGEKIFKELSPKANVKWNDSIYGHDTETKRQIDISIRAKVAEHEILEIIQLKNWKIKANINHVGEFASVVKDVRATSGVLICKGGFTTQAKQYAKNIGIKLLNLHDAESKDWNQEIKLPIFWIEYTLIFHPAGFKFFSKYDQTIHFGKRSKFTLSPDGGKTTIDIIPLFKEKWNNWEIDKTPNKKHKFQLPDNLSVRTILKNRSEKWQLLEDFEIIYEIKRKKTLFGYFEPHECRGVIDYHNDEAFIASHLPSFDELLKVPQKGWQKIEDPDKVVVNIKTTFLTVEKFDRIKQIGAKMCITEEDSGKTNIL